MRLEWTAKVGNGPFDPLIPNLQTVTYFQGKRKISDSYRGASTSITGRNFGSLPTINLYDEIVIRAINPDNGVTMFQWSAFVIDVELDYGIVTNQDTWTISLTDGTVFISTALMNSLSFTAGDSLTKAIQDFTFAIPGFSAASFSGIPSLRVSAQTVTGENALDVFTKLVNTGALQANVSEQSIAWQGPYTAVGATPANYTDTGTGTTPIKYDKLRFSSMTDNFAPVIEIKPQGLSPVVSGVGNISATFDTYSFSASEAGDIADYYNILYSSDTSVPSEISFLYSMIPTIPIVNQSQVGLPVDVTIRGATYESLCCGVAISADVEDTRHTAFLYERDINNYLILDDVVFGRLDSDRLGL